jgi:2-polyprenyl-3-methyl-5-hydroxy-6-metoxy-1,4-benzoquinol methylase
MLSSMAETRQLPEVIVPRLPDNWTYRYYYTDEFPFGRAPSQHIRKRRLAEIGAWLMGEKPRAALDVGCGPAEMSALIHLLRGAECQVVSLDLGVDFVGLAGAIAQANGAQLQFVVGNAIKLPLEPASFDLVVTMEMVEHVPQWATFISESARVLRPNGLLIISTPTRAGFHSWLKRIKQWFTGWEKVNQACLRGEGQDYEKFLARNEVVAEAEKRGFVLEDCKVKIFVFSIIPPALFGINLLMEKIFETFPGISQLGVTRFYKFRKK